MYTRTDTLNSRSYAEQLKIAKNAMETIELIKKNADESTKKHGYSHIERPDMKYIFFTITQLRMIAFDYAFSALENFLEHIGFILFYDWDSNKNQRHYRDKIEKLLLFDELVDNKIQPNLDYAKLEREWVSIINSVEPSMYNSKRNPIKHTHADRHDGKKQTITTNSTLMNSTEYEALVDGTYLALNDDDCQRLMVDVEKLINSVNLFLNEHKLIFRIYCDNSGYDRVEIRRRLLDTFKINPLAGTLYGSHTQLHKSSE